MASPFVAGSHSALTHGPRVRLLQRRAMECSREVELLWVALDEERQVVKMKNDVICSLQHALRVERQNCDALTAQLREAQNNAQVHKQRPELAVQPEREVFDDFPDDDSVGSSMPDSDMDERVAELDEKLRQAATALHRERVLAASRAAVSRDVLQDAEARLRASTRSAEADARASLMEQVRWHGVLVESASYQRAHIAFQRDAAMEHGWLIALEAMTALGTVASQRSDAVARELFRSSSELTTHHQKLTALEAAMARVLRGDALVDLHLAVLQEEMRASKRALQRVDGFDRMWWKWSGWLDATLALMASHGRSSTATFAASGSAVVSCNPRPATPARGRLMATPHNGDSRPSPAADATALVARVRQLEERIVQKTKLIAAQARRIEQLEQATLPPPVDVQGTYIDATNAGLPGERLRHTQTDVALAFAACKAECAAMFADAHQLLGVCALRLPTTLTPRSSTAPTLPAATQQPRPENDFAVSLAPVRDASPTRDAPLDQVQLASAALDEADAAAYTRRWVAYASSVMLDGVGRLQAIELESQQRMKEVFFALAPTRRTSDSVKLQICENSLALVEVQRDQSLTVANWMHNEATEAVRKLSSLVSRVDTCLKGDKAKAQVALIADPAEALAEQERSKDADNAARRSVTQFSAICDSLLDRAGRMHVRLLEHEAAVAKFRSTASECEVSTVEYRRAADAAAVTNRLERQMNDDALQLLHRHLAAERACAGEGLRALGAACVHRNLAIRSLQADVQRLSLSAHAATLLAQYAMAACGALQEEVFTALNRRAAHERARALPSSAEVEYRMLVVHAELGLALEAGVETALGFVKGTHDAAVRSSAIAEEHTAQMVAASTELITVARQRRIERDAVVLMQAHAVELAADFAHDASDLAEQAILDQHALLTSALTERTRATCAAAEAESARRAAEARMMAMEQEGCDVKFAATAAVDRAAAMEAAAETASLELAALRTRYDDADAVAVRREQAVRELEREQARLAQLLDAEKQAHNIAKNHEDSLGRELREVQAKLAAAQGSVDEASAALEREKEAHRATIKSFARQ